MIKAISYLRPTASTEAYERLSGFLAALGFAQGKGWQDGTSTAASFSAPLAKIELIDGAMQYPSDIFVEVTSVDGAFQAADAWLRLQDGEPGSKQLKAIEETNWGSRMFTVVPEPGVEVS